MKSLLVSCFVVFCFLGNQLHAPQDDKKDEERHFWNSGALTAEGPGGTARLFGIDLTVAAARLLSRHCDGEPGAEGLGDSQ